MRATFTLCHTADWHLGHTFHGRSREAEHDRFLAWLIEVVTREEVDALVVAGDVFDSSNPSGVAQAQLYRFLAALRERRAVDVLLIAGNHDSPGRLSAPDPVLRALGGRAIGQVPWRGAELDASSLVVPLRAGGRVAARVAAIPYLRAPDLPLDGSDDDLATRIARGTREVVGAVAAAAERERRTGEALVVVSHAHLAGARVSASSERAVVGGAAGVVPVDVMPSAAGYVALGHLHLAQAVGRDEVRYSGSPIPLAFTEASYAHEVRVVRFEDGVVASSTGHVVPRHAALVRVPAAGPGGIDEALDAIAGLDLDASLPPDRWPYLEVRVRLERPEPALRARVEAALAGRAVRLVKIEVERERGSVSQVTGRELADDDPREVFARRWRDLHEAAPPDDVEAAFQAALEAAHARAAERARSEPSGAIDEGAP